MLKEQEPALKVPYHLFECSGLRMISLQAADGLFKNKSPSQFRTNSTCSDLKGL